MTNLLILGGTSEATLLCQEMAGEARFTTTISLAGRTRHPAPQPVPSRVGGFGGVDGLASYLRMHRVTALVDATHPFASRITINAIIASCLTGTPFLRIVRPAWQQTAGDRWIIVPDMGAAALALGADPRRVLLTVGRKDLAPFAIVPWHHYVLRSIDRPPPDALPPLVDVIAARGPFALADESRLLTERRIEVIVTKNSGGIATQAKLAAARTLGLPVIMVARPPDPPCNAVATVTEAIKWLVQLHEEAPRGE